MLYACPGIRATLLAAFKFGHNVGNKKNVNNSYFCSSFLKPVKYTLNMKKSLLGMLAGALLTFGLASCGEKLLTDEQVKAEIEKGFEAGKGAVEKEMNDKCDAEFETRVTAEVERLKAEAEASEVVQ